MKYHVRYLIKLNNELYYETESLREARKIAKSLLTRLEIENLDHEVKIENHTTTVKVLNEYKPEKIIVNDMF